MGLEVALASVVTSPFVEEFGLLKFSCELLHRQRFRWYVRCDESAALVLAKDPDILVTRFSPPNTRRVSPGDSEFMQVALQKAEALADAWKAESSCGVAFLDADLIFTAPLLQNITHIDTDLVLTPNYHASGIEAFEPFHGYFNSGFLFTRTAQFHQLWRQQLIARSWEFTDQVCLNDVCANFSITPLDKSANVGFWHSPEANTFRFEPIPVDCSLLHVHCFHVVAAPRGWRDRMFALHCLRFLSASPIQEHRLLLEEVLSRDVSGWFRASLSLTAGTVK
jgi:hypothetical protein